MKGLVAPAILLALSACGQLRESPTAPDGPPPDPTATFTRVQQEVFTPNCALSGCHAPPDPQQGLVLTAGSSYASIVNRASLENPSLLRIAPSDPEASYLYRKVTGSGIAGMRMPLGGAPLSQAQLDLIRDWIRRGAPND